MVRSLAWILASVPEPILPLPATRSQAWSLFFSFLFSFFSFFFFFFFFFFFLLKESLVETALLEANRRCCVTRIATSIFGHRVRLPINAS